MKAIIVVIALAILAALGRTQDMPVPGICGVSAIRPQVTSRIINGETAIQHSRPYQLLLIGFLPNGTAKYYCGASLIKSTHVLTAAHCVAGNDAKDLRLYAGVHEFNLNVMTMSNGLTMRQYWTHESYNNRSLTNDIAVIRLQVPLNVDNIKVGLVCLAGPSTPACQVGDPVVASGWGSTSGSPNRTSASRPAFLQQVALQIVDATNADCKQLSYTTIFNIPISADKSKMCAYAENKGVCFGDSGGPLVRERSLPDGTRYVEQVGVMSGTIDCSFARPRPDVYANVRELHKWVMDKVKASL